MLNPAEGQALYVRVADALRERINSGDLSPGDRMPTEFALMEEFGVGRNTARSALQALVAEGAIVGLGRKGYFVRQYQPTQWKVSHFESGDRKDDVGRGHDAWAADVAAQGRTPRQDISVAIVPPPADVKADLDLASGDLVVVRKRLRWVDDVPTMIADSYFPESIARGTPLMDEGDVTLPGGILAAIGHPQARTRDVVGFRLPTPDEAQRLSLPDATAVGTMRRIGYAADGQPVRVMYCVLPGDRNELVYELDN